MWCYHIDIMPYRTSDIQASETLLGEPPASTVCEGYPREPADPVTGVIPDQDSQQTPGGEPDRELYCTVTALWPCYFRFKTGLWCTLEPQSAPMYWWVRLVVTQKYQHWKLCTRTLLQTPRLLILTLVNRKDCLPASAEVVVFIPVVTAL